MNRGVVENLIKSGAFDSLDPNRAKLLNALPQLTELAARKAQNTNQASLFGDDEEDFFTPEMEEVPDFSERQKLDLEKESMGLYISGHPFDQYEPSVEPYITCPVGDLPNWRSHQPAVTAGLLTNFTEKFSKAGNPFGTAVIEDNRGTVDMLIFGKRWPLYKHTLQKGALYFVKGQPKDDRGVSLMVDDIYSEEEYKEKLERRAVITVESDGLGDKFYDGLFSILRAHPGRCELIIKLHGSAETSVSLIRNIKVDVTDELRKELEDYSNGLVSCL